MTFYTKLQQLVWDEFRKDKFLTSAFYFTGGTALSLAYLKHRESDDLDFFSENNFESSIVLEKVTTWGRKHRLEIASKTIEEMHVFELISTSGERLRLDFNHYPYQRLAKGRIIQSVVFDSLKDIAVNKLLTTNQRTDVKDFVDLYFLLRNFTVWDLIAGVEVKFRVKLEPLIVASDFMKATEFDYLPKMLKPLKTEDLRDFFRAKAKSLGLKSVE